MNLIRVMPAKGKDFLTPYFGTPTMAAIQFASFSLAIRKVLEANRETLVTVGLS